jgi:hypothetical protein
LVAAGEMNVNEKLAFTTDGTIGNVFADVCDKPVGCSVKVEGYKAGHIGITVIFGGYEIAQQTVADSVNTMLDGASNCGNRCLIINVGYVDGTTESFSYKTSASDIAVIKQPVAPYTKVNIIQTDVPSGAKVVLDDVDQPSGHTYFLSEKEAKVSVPETGGTIVYCGTKCSINGQEFSAGIANVFVGNTDGTTPKDLNQTIEIGSKDPSMIRVIMIYAGDFSAQVTALKAQYPDWEWAE